MAEQKKRIMLVAFYNVKALGVRYLESALVKHGYDVTTVFYKTFNSNHPTVTTERELELLVNLIQEKQPMMIGLSVMSSMYLESVEKVMHAIKEHTDIPMVCGGAFASMFPQKMMENGAEFVIRLDGEHAICSLADAIRDGQDYSKIPSLCYQTEEKAVINEIGALCDDINEYGIPAIHCADSCLIEQNTLTWGDPQLSTMSYEVIASRGCPFTCSYCCCNNLAKMLPDGIKRVRTRSVESVINELIAAKKELKKLVFVHFYDEIFPNSPGWVDEFIVQYQKHIHLPFTIWSHPKMVDPEVLKKLVSVGLCEVITGIQSGSPTIRSEVFHRFETNEDVLKSVKTIRESGVFWASYDFMLQHPFETIDTMKETFELVKQFEPPVELQMHGLNFLPGTDIVDMALEQGKVSEEHMNKIMFASMEDQFGAYWNRDNERESMLWYRLTYCLQFKKLKQKAILYSEDIEKYEQAINQMYEKAQKMFRRRYFFKKARVVLKRYQMKLFH